MSCKLLSRYRPFTCCKATPYVYVLTTVKGLGGVNTFMHPDGMTSVDVRMSLRTVATAVNRCMLAWLVKQRGGKGMRVKSWCQILTPKLIPKVQPNVIPKVEPNPAPKGIYTLYKENKLN